MGTIILKTTIITTTEEKAKEIRRAVKKIMGDQYKFLVSKPIKHLVNGNATFMIAPDGSKLGWNTHEEFSRLREDVIEYLSDLTYRDGIVEVVQIETGECEPTITRYY